MKSIANQYRDLKEGKMSQANFMRNLRISMPQVTNVMSFGDAVKVLKNKGIITESFDITEKENDEYPIPEVAIEEPNENAEFDAMLKQIEDEMAGEEAVKGQYDETLTEAKETINPNKVHPQEYTMGIRYELKGAKGDVVKAERAVLKNLSKEPFYYTTLKLSGKDIYKEKATKPEVTIKKKKATKPELVDKANGMTKVKMPKTVKEAMEINPQGQLNQTIPPDVERIFDKMRIAKIDPFLAALNTLPEHILYFEDLYKKENKIKGELDPQQKEAVKKIAQAWMRLEKPNIPSQIFNKNADIQKGINDIGGIKEKLTALVREMLAEKEEAPSKKKAAEEITAKTVDYIDDYNEGEKTYKKSQLENVFDSYEDKVGRRFDDSVFEDVIDMLKAKGYTMTMKEMFDGRDNLTDISDDTK
jgi:hypothetical protein